MTHIRIRYKEFGKHVHCRIFTSPILQGTYANCGYAIFDTNEWGDIQKLVKAEFILEPDLKEVRR